MRRFAGLACVVVLAGCAGDDEQSATVTTPEEPAPWAIAFIRDGALVMKASTDGAGLPVTEGSMFRQVVDRNPAFSPNGRSIAFVSDRGQQPQDDLYVLETGGGEPRRLTTDTRIELEPSWLDGANIVFVSCAVDFAECEVTQIRANGRGRKTLRNVRGPVELDVDRESGLLVLARATGTEIDLDVFSDALRGGRERRLTRRAGRDHEPDVGPEGRIAFARDAAGAGTARDIFVMESDGTGAKQLTDDGADDSAPAWSPDGRRIAWVRMASSGAGDSELWMMNADGSCQQALTANERSDAQPAWDPRYPPGPIDC